MSQYYKKYMKKREEEKPSYFKLFIGAFLVVIVFFGIFATHLTAGVDTSIGENDEGDIKESGLGVKHLIDSRLRFIQMEDASAPAPKKEKDETLEQYGKTIKEEADKGYEGQYKNSYGYEPTQETKPYSQTYSNTNKTQPVSTCTNSSSTASNGVHIPSTKPASTSTTSGYPTKTYTVPVPAQTKTTPSGTATHKTTTPAHGIQKNLTPTGF